MSIPQQEAKIGEWCKTHGFALVRVFKDAARSGTTTAGRDAFLDLFSYLSSGAEVAGVVIWEYARFSRQYDDAMFYLSDLRRQGYGVYSLSDAIPAGLEGRLMEGIIAYTNARYSADLSRNVKRGKAYVVTALHGWPHAVPPTGYQKVYYPAGTRRDGTPHMVARLEPDPDTAPLIQRAFQLRARGAAYTEIRQAVSLASRNGNLAPILRNPIYIGTYEYGTLRVENYCPPIVDLDTWEKAQEINAAARLRSGVYHSRRINSPFLLSGLVTCARCGSPLTGLHTKPKAHLGHYSYYMCPNRPYIRNSSAYCDAPGVPKELLEGGVLSRLLDLLDTPQVLVDVHAELARQVEQQDASRQADLRKVQADLDDTARRIQRITSAIQAAGHSAALITDLTSLEARRDELTARLFAIANKAPRPSPPVDLPALAADLRAALSEASGRDLQKLFRLTLVAVKAELLDGALVGELQYKIGDAAGVLAL